MAGRETGSSGEGSEAGDGAADDERLHGLGALEGMDRFHVDHVPHDLVVKQDAVAAEHVPRLGGNRAGLAGVVHLGQPGHGGGQPARLGQPSDLQAVQLHRGEVRQHRHQPLLDDLDRAGLSRMASLWRMFLLTGIAWLILSWVALRFNPASVPTVGVLLGVLLLVAMLSEFFIAAVLPSWRWLHVVMGVIFAFGAGRPFARPENAFSTLASILVPPGARSAAADLGR